MLSRTLRSVSLTAVATLTISEFAPHGEEEGSLTAAVLIAIILGRAFPLLDCVALFVHENHSMTRATRRRLIRRTQAEGDENIRWGFSSDTTCLFGR